MCYVLKTVGRYWLWLRAIWLFATLLLSIGFVWGTASIDGVLAAEESMRKLRPREWRALRVLRIRMWWGA